MDYFIPKPKVDVTKNIFYTDFHGATDFIKALQSKDSKKIKEFTNKDCEMETVTCDGNSALFIGYDMYKNSSIGPDIMIMMIDKLDNINIVDKDGNTIMHRLVADYLTDTYNEHIKIYSEPNENDFHYTMNGNCFYVLGYGISPCADFDEAFTPIDHEHSYTNSFDIELTNKVSTIKNSISTRSIIPNIEMEKKINISKSLLVNDNIYSKNPLIEKVLNREDIDFCIKNDEGDSIYTIINNKMDMKLVNIMLLHKNFNITKMLDAVAIDFKKCEIIKCAIIDLLMNKGADVNNAIITAVNKNDLFLLRKLLSKKCKVNVDDLLQISMDQRCYNLISNYKNV